MIAMKDVRSALSSVIKANFPDWQLTYNNNPDAGQDYIYVELTEKRQTVDPVYYDRDILIDIQVVPLPDARGNVKRSLLYEAQDTLEHAILPVFKLNDRFITVQETSSRIVDEVLHFSFSLRFADYEPEESQDLMDTLYINRFTEEE